VDSDILTMSNPTLDLSPQPAFAGALFLWFAGHLKADPAYVERLKHHYAQVKDAELDPAQPAHEKFLAWQARFRPPQEHSNEGQRRKQGPKRVTVKNSQTSRVPLAMLARYEEITALTDRFCQDYLNDEYRDLCRKMTAALARKRPSPLSGGKASIWAAGITYALGQVNFLFDPSQTPSMRANELCAGYGVSQRAASSKARQIRDLIKTYPMDPHWCLPGLIDQNPLAWMISVNGLIVDARLAPYEIQEDAYRKGLIPYIPGEP
jgi:hypothetical protein